MLPTHQPTTLATCFTTSLSPPAITTLRVCRNLRQCYFTCQFNRTPCDRCFLRPDLRVVSIAFVRSGFSGDPSLPRLNSLQSCIYRCYRHGGIKNSADAAGSCCPWLQQHARLDAATVAHSASCRERSRGWVASMITKLHNAVPPPFACPGCELLHLLRCHTLLPLGACCCVD
jgi:hypothetical protein